MKEYTYVRLDCWSKVWHLSRSRRIALCGIQPRYKREWYTSRFGLISTDPRDPLCKRCAKSREAKGR